MVTFAKFRQKVYDDWGFGDKHSYGRGISARCSRARPAPARPWSPASSRASSTWSCSASTCRAWSRSGSARPRRTSARCSTRRSAARDHPVRRGRLAVRQAHRGQVVGRSLRQPRGQLPPAAHGGVRRHHDPDHQLRRDTIDPAFKRRLTFRIELPVARRRGARAAVAEHVARQVRDSPATSTSQRSASASSSRAATSATPRCAPPSSPPRAIVRSIRKCWRKRPLVSRTRWASWSTTRPSSGARTGSGVGWRPRLPAPLPLPSASRISSCCRNASRMSAPRCRAS